MSARCVSHEAALPMRQRLLIVLIAALTALVFLQTGSARAATEGTVHSWGENDFGQLGDGTTTGSSTPGNVKNLTAVSIASGRDHGLALQADGTVWSWGINSYG